MRFFALLTLVLAMCLLATCLLAQAKLEITSPIDRLLVHPGQTITVEASGSGAAFLQVILVGQDPLGFYSPQAQSPYRLSVHIPSRISPGTYTLTAFGLSLSKQEITSQPLTIDIEQSQHLLSLRAEPSRTREPCYTDSGITSDRCR
jgi:hypothetical protein